MKILIDIAINKRPKNAYLNLLPYSLSLWCIKNSLLCTAHPILKNYGYSTSYLLFNRYQMATPAYRETKNRLADMDWRTCRQNLFNWADKGILQLNKLVPALKQIALQESADVNVDETWECYQTHYGHRKTYMWCLVNRKARIVMFFYEDCEDEDGSKHEELVDIEHLCCIAHARAKFKTAYDQGCEKTLFFWRRWVRYTSLRRITEGLSFLQIISIHFGSSFLLIEIMENTLSIIWKLKER